MTLPTKFAASLTALAIATTCFARPVFAQDDAAPHDLDVARKALFVEALQAMAKKDWATCRVRALGVWSQKPHAQVAGLLGICEGNLGMDLEAAEHIAYYRKNDDKSSPTRTKDVDAAWDLVRARIAVIEIETNPPGADLIRDGKRTGVTPHTLYLRAGMTTFELGKDGFETRAESLNAEAGKIEHRQFNLKPSADTGPKQGSDATLPQWPAWLFTGVAVAGVAVGAGLLGGRASSDGEVDELVAANPKCNESSPSTGCAQINELADERNGFMTGSIVAFSVAGAATVGAVIFFVLGGSSDEKREEPPPVSFQPLLGPGIAGAQTTIVF